MDTAQRKLDLRTSVLALAIAVSIWEYSRISRVVSRAIWGPDPHDPDATDSDFLRNNSRIEEVKTRRYTYPGIRVFFKRHLEQIVLPGSLPLLVFIHGLGGSVAQFEPLLQHFTCRASCLAIDLPGCGRSKYAVTSWGAYSTDALVEFLEEVIGRYVEENQSIVLVGHSYGTVLAARIALPGNNIPGELDTSRLDTVGVVGLCPPAKQYSEKEARQLRKLLWIPEAVFDLWRAYDRRGGINSESLLRFVGSHADEATRRLQLRFNAQSRSPVFRRIAWGMIPEFMSEKYENGIPELWARLRIPVLLVCGGKDHITNAIEAEKIYAAREAITSLSGPTPGKADGESTAIDMSTKPTNSRGNENKTSSVPTSLKNTSATKISIDQSGARGSESTPTAQTNQIDIPPPPKPSMLTELITLTGPAGHGLFYDSDFVNPVAGHIAKFFTSHVTGRLDLGWQLRFLSRGGKWDVKNLAKWSAVQPVSETIAGIFRAMKTLREADDVHSPARLVEDWGNEIKDVVDISHDRPVYAPQGLIDGGITYHKFPTVSKVPPTKDEVKRFIHLVDKIRKKRKWIGKVEAILKDYELKKEVAKLKDETAAIKKQLEEETGKTELEDAMAAFENQYGERNPHEWEKDKATDGTITLRNGEKSGPKAKTSVIGVHCHYGFNRTGFFIVSYLVERRGYTIQDAVAEFAKQRPNGIRHQHFLETLWLRYAAPGSGAGSAKAISARRVGSGEGSEWGE